MMRNDSCVCAESDLKRNREKWTKRAVLSVIAVGSRVSGQVLYGITLDVVVDLVIVVHAVVVAVFAVVVNAVVVVIIVVVNIEVIYSFSSR